MALDPSTIPDRSNGQTIDETWFNLLKAFFIDQDSRIEDLDAGSNRKMNFNGIVTEMGVSTTLQRGLVTWVVEQPFTLTGMTLHIGALLGSIGSLEVKARRIRGGVVEELLITNPKVLMTNGSYTNSDDGLVGNVPAVIDSVTEEMLKDDIIRVDTTIVPTDGGGGNGLRGFHLNFQITPGT